MTDPRPPVAIIWGKRKMPKFRSATGYELNQMKAKHERKSALRLLSICGSKEKDEIFYAQCSGRVQRKNK